VVLVFNTNWLGYVPESRFGQRLGVSQLNPPWKIEFESEVAKFEPVIYEWQDLRTPSRPGKRLLTRGILFGRVVAGGFLLAVAALYLLQESASQVSNQKAAVSPSQKPRNLGSEGCDTEANAISLATREPKPRHEVDFGGVKFQTVQLTCSSGTSKWLIKYAKVGGVWQPESATEAARTPEPAG
jgi:hypothetical protein